MQLTIWSLPPLITTILAVVAYQRAQMRNQVPGVYALKLLFASLVFWSGGQTLGTLVADPTAQQLIRKVTYLGITLTPVAWFVFAITYAQRILRVSRRTLNLVSLVPATTFALALTNDFHGLVWRTTYNVKIDGFSGFVVEHGLWFYVNVAYSYALILAATSILLFALTQFRQHARTIVAAVLAPLVGIAANGFYLSPLNLSPWFDLTTVGFLLGVLILDHSILRNGVLTTVPIVRDRVVEQLSDPVLVIDERGRILDANQSAMEYWITNGGSLLHGNISSLARNVPIASLRDPLTNSEVTIRDRIYEVAATTLDSSNPEADVALVFRDMTERRKAEKQLRELKDELERMAHTDALTNMYNRRYFIQRLTEEFERGRRHGMSLAVLIFDLDHFKQINDTYGHDMGDAVLVSIADVVNEVKRVSDVACRLGGEEFALLLPETNRAGAVHLAQRLRQGIEDYPYKERCGEDMNVTASVGVATLSPQMQDPAGILKTADRALYEAKNSGRNRVCIDRG